MASNRGLPWPPLGNHRQMDQISVFKFQLSMYPVASLFDLHYQFSNFNFKLQFQFSRVRESRVKESKVQGSIVKGQRVNKSLLIGVTRWDDGLYPGARLSFPPPAFISDRPAHIVNRFSPNVWKFTTSAEPRLPKGSAEWKRSTCN